MSPTKAVFFDRDGTMGKNSNVEFPTQFSPFPNLAALILQVQRAGFLAIAATNQSCIARKKDHGYDFAAEFKHYGLDDWFICPHDSGDNCSCRKPAPGLLLAAAQKHHLLLSECYIIGDRWSDMKAGIACGCKTILVLTGRGQEDFSNNPEGIVVNFVATNLEEAVDLICRK